MHLQVKPAGSVLACFTCSLQASFACLQEANAAALNKRLVKRVAAVEEERCLAMTLLHTFQLRLSHLQQGNQRLHTEVAALQQAANTQVCL